MSSGKTGNQSPRSTSSSHAPKGSTSKKKKVARTRRRPSALSKLPAEQGASRLSVDRCRAVAKITVSIIRGLDPKLLPKARSALVYNVLTELLYHPRRENKEEVAAMLSYFLEHAAAHDESFLSDCAKDVIKLLDKAKSLKLIDTVKIGNQNRDTLHRALETGSPTEFEMDSGTVSDKQPAENLGEKSDVRHLPQEGSPSKDKLKKLISSMQSYALHGFPKQPRFAALHKLSTKVGQVVLDPIQVITCFRGQPCLGLLMAYDRQGGKREIALLNTALQVSNDYATFWYVLTLQFPTRDEKESPDLSELRQLKVENMIEKGKFLAENTKKFISFLIKSDQAPIERQDFGSPMVEFKRSFEEMIQDTQEATEREKYFRSWVSICDG